MSADLQPVTCGKVRVLLVEDHPMFRDQLAALINKEPDMSVCGEADESALALRLVRELRPDLIVLDLALKTGSGLELLKDLKAQNIDAPVLVLSMYDELLYAERVLRAGARAYVSKHETASEVMAAIRKVLAGQVYLGSRVAARLLEKVASGKPTHESALAQLADRELEVFELIGAGRTTQQICKELRLGVSTVETYRARIKTKLNLANASELTHAAIRWASERRGDSPA